MTVAEFIMDFLYEKGVRHIFTVSGGGSIFLCDALAKSQAAGKLTYVCTHHEQSAGYAAEAYSRIKGFGVTLVTSGPGGTNAVSACAASWLDGIPHLFISGQAFLAQTITNHPGLRQLGVQEIYIIPMVLPITKLALMMTKPEDVNHLQYIYDLARHPRQGPVWLDIPGDIQNARI